MRSITGGLVLGLLAITSSATWAQEKSFAGVSELLQASGSLANGERVRIRQATVTASPISSGGQLRDMDEVSNEHSFGWEAALIEPRLEDPHLDFRVGASASASAGTLRVRLITRAYYDDGDGELVESEVRHAPLQAGHRVELRGRLLRSGGQRFLFVEPTLGSEGVHADGALRVQGKEDGSALAPVILGALYGSGVAKAGGTVTLQGYFLETSTRLRAQAGGQSFDLPVESVNPSQTRLVARVPAALPHGVATVGAVGGSGLATIGVVHAPVISSVNPTSVRAGERIVIEGRALTGMDEIEKIEEGQPTIRIDGTSNLKVLELSQQRIVAELSVYEQPGAHQLVIQNEAGTAKIALQIVEALGPTIASIEPAGAYLLLRGQDFGTSPRVLFRPEGAAADVAGEVVLRSANALLVRRPAGADKGTVKVVGGVLGKAGPEASFDTSTPGLVGGLTPH